jgi:hypothetical protein
MDARTNIKGRLPSRHGTEGLARAVHASYVAASSNAINAAPHLSVIEFDLNDAGEIFKKTPCAAGLKPAGRYLAKDMPEVGGIPLLMKTLLENGQLDGNCLTVTGRTITENLKGVSPIAVIDGVVGLKGILAPEGAVVKVAGMSKLKFTGPAHCFDREEEAFETSNVKLTDAEHAEHETKSGPERLTRSRVRCGMPNKLGRRWMALFPHPGGAHEKQYYADI